MVFFKKIALVNLGSLYFYVNFSISLSISILKKPLEFLLELHWICRFGGIKIAILMIQSLLIDTQPCSFRPYHDGQFSVMTLRAGMEMQVCSGDLEEAAVVFRQCWVETGSPPRGRSLGIERLAPHRPAPCFLLASLSPCLMRRGWCLGSSWPDSCWESRVPGLLNMYRVQSRVLWCKGSGDLSFSVCPGTQPGKKV